MIQLCHLTLTFKITHTAQATHNYCCAATEMLIQSHMGFIHILPALPDAWEEGTFNGVRAKGGFEIDLTWKDGKPVEIIVKSTQGGKCNLRYGNETLSFGTKKGRTYKVTLVGEKLKKA